MVRQRSGSSPRAKRHYLIYEITPTPTRAIHNTRNKACDGRPFKAKIFILMNYFTRSVCAEYVSERLCGAVGH
ncbi:hypothetical protein E2C01_041575 [Portunus trituberculatus]|uniref:Uncharacterized protein n=1 Tax=Portunus trituberculatus TaxID=210409 RepID=A0A5B7FS89_PORTR|nr:hypothetical protein [Portunus trituberculatus]